MQGMTYKFDDLTDRDVELIFLGLDELKRKKSNQTFMKLSRQVQLQVNNNILEAERKSKKGEKNDKN